MRRIRQSILGLLGLLASVSGCTCDSKPQEVFYAGPPIPPTSEVLVTASLYELNRDHLCIEMRIAGGKDVKSNIRLQDWDVPDQLAIRLAEAIDAANEAKAQDFPERDVGRFQIASRKSDLCSVVIRHASGGLHELSPSHAQQVANNLRLAPAFHTRLLENISLDSARAIERTPPPAAGSDLPPHLTVKIRTYLGTVTNRKEYPLAVFGRPSPECKLTLEIIATREKTTAKVLIDNAAGLELPVDGWHKIAETSDACADAVRKSKSFDVGKTHDIEIGISETKGQKYVGIRKKSNWVQYDLEMTLEDTAEFTRLVRLAPGVAKWVHETIPVDAIVRGN